MLRLFNSSGPRYASLALPIITLLLAAPACNRAKDVSHIGTFHMGERVQAGPLIYTVLEAEWKPQLENGKTPANRFLFIKVAMTNSSGAQVVAPGFTLKGPGEKVYTEVTEGLEGVQNWLGLFRTVTPAQTEQGYVIFDAPVGAYKMVLSDGGEVGNEKYANVEIPAQLE
jgi:hypothetical protein